MNNEEVQESPTYSTRSANVIPFPTVKAPDSVIGSIPVKPTQLMWYTARVYVSNFPENGKSYETGIHVNGFVNYMNDAKDLNDLIDKDIKNKLGANNKGLKIDIKYFIVESYLNTSKDFQ